jgi:ABC-type nitrate/sulfonate/bicarbonate transport system substrate-binding protein
MRKARGRGSRWVVVMVAGVAALATGCGDSSSDASSSATTPNATKAAPVETLTVGIPAVAADVLTYIAQAKGYFTQQGVKVNIVDNTGANTSSLVVSGKLDIALYSAPTALIVAGQGKPTSIIYGLGGESQGASLFGATGKVTSIDKLKALKSCRIATYPPGSNTYGAAVFYKQKYGLKCDLVPFQDPGSQLGALESGRADVIVGSYPNYAGAVGQKKIVAIIDTRDPKQRADAIGTDYVTVVYFGLTDKLKSKSAAVAKFLKAVNQSVDFAKQSSPQAIADLLKQFTVFGSLTPEGRLTTVSSILPYLLGGSQDGYITPDQWSLALKNYGTWGLPKFDPNAAVNSLQQRVDMSYYKNGIGAPAAGGGG